MADNKIPVLTEVYKPKKNVKSDQSVDGSLAITSELVAKVASQIKPKLETEITEQILATLRSEMNMFREGMIASTHGSMEKASTGDALEVISELSAKVTAQVKPRLEAEITDFVLDELRGEIKKASEEIILSTQNFLDRAKADLKTELPNMYQESVRLAQINLADKFADLHVEASAKFDTSISEIADVATQAAQLDLSSRVAQSFEQSMLEFQPKALAENQALLEAQLEEITQTAQQTLTQQLQAFQEEIIVRHQSELNAALNIIRETVNESAEQTMRAELSATQERIIQDHQKQLSESLDGFLQTKGEAAEKELLQTMQEYQEKLRIRHQEIMAENMESALESIAQRVEESTLEQIGVMHSQVGTIQQETFTRLREDFNVEKNTIFSSAADEINTTLTEQMTAQSQGIRNQFLVQVNGDLPEVQAILQENIQSILEKTLPDLESRLREQLTTDLQNLLLKVKFVLPE